MSAIWKNPKYSPRQLENLWMNSVFQLHDNFCQCNDTILHLMIIINKNSDAPKPEPEISNIKCLLTGTTEKEDTPGEDDIGIDAGELEKLFEEDGAEEKG